MSAQKKFGGDWSDTKLKALANYLRSYALVLKNAPFRKTYIDAFAGAGSQLNSDDPEDEEDAQYRHGSPLIALETEPPFDDFIFIDKDGAKLEELKHQVAARGHADRNMSFQSGDANGELLKICRMDWRFRRAVAFLDPFALQVRWETIQAIARTQAIDMWLLFPAMAVNRMLTRSGSIDEKWQSKLDVTFGETSWRDEFYQTETPDLFGHQQVSKKDEPFKILSGFVTTRLEKEFAKANKQPLVLKNSSNTPIFLLCFACGNEKGAAPALRIADHIIQQST